MLSAAGVPLQAIELGESVSKFVLWELMAIYGCREYDPESFSPYELRNGVNEERDEELSLLVFAHWQEDANDKGLSAVRWVKLHGGHHAPAEGLRAGRPRPLPPEPPEREVGARAQGAPGALPIRR